MELGGSGQGLQTQGWCEWVVRKNTRCLWHIQGGHSFTCVVLHPALEASILDRCGPEEQTFMLSAHIVDKLKLLFVFGHSWTPTITHQK